MLSSSRAAAAIFLLQVTLFSIAAARTPSAGGPVYVEIKRSSVPGSSTVRIKNAVQQPYLSLKAMRAGSGSWVSFRPSDLSVRVPRGLADRLASAARSGPLKVTTGMGDYGCSLLRLTAGEGKSRVVLQRTRFSIGSEALQVQLGDRSKPVWIARASVKANTAVGKIRGASGVSRWGDATLLDPLTLKVDSRPAKIGSLRWFSQTPTRASLLAPFLPAEQWRRATVTATLVTEGRAPPANKPAERVTHTAKRPAQPKGRSSSTGKMTPASFDPVALLARKKIDASQLKFVPSFGKATTGLQIYYRGEPIGYYSRDATHRSMQLSERFHGKGIGTIAYLVMTKLFFDSGRGLLTSDSSSEGRGAGNLSPQAQEVWHRFVSSGFADAHRAGSFTIYSMKQSAIDSVRWDRFTSFLTDRRPVAR